jgi:hypothetical protein
MKFPRFILATLAAAVILSGVTHGADAPVRIRDLKPEAKKPVEPEAKTAKPAVEKPKNVAPAKPKHHTLRGGEVPVTLPIGRVKTAPSSASLRDGESIIGRTIRVRFNDATGFWAATCLPETKQRTYPQMRLLPCRLLEALQPMAKKEPKTLFNITGELCIHNKKVYLLLRRVTVLDEQTPSMRPATPKPATPAKPAPAAAKPTSAKPTPKPIVTKPEDATPAKPAPPKSASGATDNLIRGMLDQAAPGKAVLTAPAKARTKEENISPVAPAGKTPEVERNSILVNRLVRVIAVKRTIAERRSNKPTQPLNYELQFVGDNTLREPPMRILPNSKLAEALKLTSGLGRTRWKLHVSGEITSYQSKRFVLLRKVTPYRDMNQF